MLQVSQQNNRENVAIKKDDFEISQQNNKENSGIKRDCIEVAEIDKGFDFTYYSGFNIKEIHHLILMQKKL